MNTISTRPLPTLLDCTLRDGGYYTSWDFDDALVTAYLESMSRLPIDVVEVGYANTPKQGYFGKYYFLSPKVTSWARSILSPTQTLAVMLDEKAVSPGDIPELLEPHVDSVGLVRIAVAPTRLAQAADLAHALSESGFRVGVNVMYLSKYWDAFPLLSGLGSVAENSEIVSLVDSYGACMPDQVAHAISSAASHLSGTAIGFHGHDNLGLALANSLSAANHGATVIDGTVLGMGRGPGNTRTELLLAQRFASSDEEMDFVALDTAMQEVDGLLAEHRWGTNLAYMISGAAGLPQNEVMDWIGKNRYSVPAIVQALHGDRVENLDTTDYPRLNVSGRDREVIIVGGGSSVSDHLEGVLEYSASNDAIVLHANYRHLDVLARIRAEQYICLAGDGASRVPAGASPNDANGLIVPSGPRFKGSIPSTSLPIYEAAPFDAGDSSEKLGPVSDIGPLALALGVATWLGARTVTLVGFDGYKNATTAQQELARETQVMIDSFRTAFPDCVLTSATRTIYDVPASSIYSRLQVSEKR